MAKKDKELEQEMELAGLVYDITKQRENLAGLIETYRSSAYEAAKMGRDEYANELLESASETKAFIEDLAFIELEIKTAALTAKAFKSLKKLPAALAGVTDVFAKGIKIGKLGENLKKLRETLKNARGQFGAIRDAVSSDAERAHRSIFGASKESGISDRAKSFYEEERRALEAKLAVEGSATAPVAAPTQAATSEAAARVDAITAMLDEEKRKK